MTSLKLSKHRAKIIRTKFNIVSGIFGGLGIVVFAVWLSQCKPPTPKKDDFVIQSQYINPDNLFCKPGDEVILSVESPNQVEWIYDTFNGIECVEDGNTLTVIVDAEVVITNVKEFEVEAKDGEKVAKISIEVGSDDFKPPLNSSIFSLTKTVNDFDTITGFNPDVVSNLSLLDTYEVLDFSNQENVKYISGECVFAKTVFDTWKPKKIDFGSLTFLPNIDTKSTGEKLFEGYELSGLIEIDFNNSVWASSGVLQSAHETFRNANLSNLKLIDFSNARFAASGMSTNLDSVCTAYNTFREANLENLKKLNFGNAKFAEENMTTNSYVQTACYTFNDAHMENLELLDLKGAIFSSKNMTQSGRAETAYGTFGYAHLNNLTSLNLAGAVFASEQMANSGEISTATGMFLFADLENLVSLELDGVEFAVPKMTTEAKVQTAYFTFYGTEFPSLEVLDLQGTVFSTEEMSQTGDILTANDTFDSAIFTSLKNLSLKDVVFASQNMTQTGIISTGCNTFLSADLQNLESLELNGAIFATENMAQSKMVYSARNTFDQTNLNKLKTLDLKGMVVAVPNMIQSRDVYTGYRTFQNAGLNGLENLNLNEAVFSVVDMTTNGEEFVAYEMFRDVVFPTTRWDMYLPLEYDVKTLGNWNQTFTNHSDCGYLLIHGYSSAPTWFVNNWWLGAIWDDGKTKLVISLKYWSNNSFFTSPGSWNPWQDAPCVVRINNSVIDQNMWNVKFSTVDSEGEPLDWKNLPFVLLDDGTLSTEPKNYTWSSTIFYTLRIKCEIWSTDVQDESSFIGSTIQTVKITFDY